MACEKKDCIYYGVNTGTCDYILVEKRSRPCPIDGCIKYIPAASFRQKVDRRIPKRLTNSQVSMIKTRFYLGDSDLEVAERMGMTIEEIRRFRYKVQVDQDFAQILRGEEDPWQYLRINNQKK